MKRFSLMALLVSMACIGAATVADNVGAAFNRSDEKALEIIRRARTAIGGDANVDGVRSMIITGRNTRTVTINGVDRSETGETEIAFEAPNKLVKRVKIGSGEMGDIANAEKIVDVVVVGKDGAPIAVDGEAGEFTSEDGKKIVIKRKGGAEAGKIIVQHDGEPVNKTYTTEDGKTVVVRKEKKVIETSAEGEPAKQYNALIRNDSAGAPRDNELLRTMLSLLVTAPADNAVVYKFVGETSIEGIDVNAVSASFAGTDVKLYFDRTTSLPVAMAFVASPSVIRMRVAKDGNDMAEPKGDVIKFRHKVDGGDAGGVEQIVRFTDHRNTGGVLLPYRWATSIGGKQTDVYEVTSYELNPANISEKFKGGEKVILRKAGSK